MIRPQLLQQRLRWFPQPLAGTAEVQRGSSTLHSWMKTTRCSSLLSAASAIATRRRAHSADQTQGNGRFNLGLAVVYARSMCTIRLFSHMLWRAQKWPFWSCRHMDMSCAPTPRLCRAERMDSPRMLWRLGRDLTRGRSCGAGCSSSFPSQRIRQCPPAPTNSPPLALSSLTRRP